MKQKHLSGCLQNHNSALSRCLKAKRLSQPLLSSQQVKQYLLSLGIEPLNIFLIRQQKGYRWVIKTLIGGETKVLTLSFQAYRIRIYSAAPDGKMACPHSKIKIKSKIYRIREKGVNIDLIEIKKK